MSGQGRWRSPGGSWVFIIIVLFLAFSLHENMAAAGSASGESD